MATAGGNSAITLLWVDMMRLEDSSSAAPAFASRFTTRTLKIGEKTGQVVHHGLYDALVFEYDYPDRASLNVLRLTKHQFPSIPLIMLTEQHSESLAVWALHTRVWDYLVKPVTSRQVSELYDEFLELKTLNGRRHETREMVHRDESIPAEFRIGDVVDTANRLQRSTDFISSHLAEKITLEGMASLCHMSPFRFSRLFKKAYGVTFQSYLTTRRIKEAARLLENPGLQVADAAYLVGFRDPSHFSRMFKKTLGISPTTYQEQQEKTRQRPRVAYSPGGIDDRPALFLSF